MDAEDRAKISSVKLSDVPVRAPVGQFFDDGEGGSAGVFRIGCLQTEPEKLNG